MKEMNRKEFLKLAVKGTAAAAVLSALPSTLTAYADEGEKLYIQVANDISDPVTFNREVKPLLKIRDAYPKMVISRTYQPCRQYEGIEIIDAAEWLVE